MGHRDFMRKHLENVFEQHEVLLQGVPDLQSAWLLLLHCPSSRANYHLLVLRQEMVLQFAQAHDENMWRGRCRILEVPAMARSKDCQRSQFAPTVSGWFGLEKRHPHTSVCIMGKLGGHSPNGAEPASAHR